MEILKKFLQLSNEICKYLRTMFAATQHHSGNNCDRCANKFLQNLLQDSRILLNNPYTKARIQNSYSNNPSFKESCFNSSTRWTPGILHSRSSTEFLGQYRRVIKLKFPGGAGSQFEIRRCSGGWY